jgi:hypothetical protein
MAALHQHVAGDGQLHAGRRRQQRAIVADAQRVAPTPQLPITSVVTPWSMLGEKVSSQVAWPS